MSNRIAYSRERDAAFVPDVASFRTRKLSMGNTKGPQDGSQLEERLSPAEVANFAGSLVVNNLDITPKAIVVRGNKGKAAVWAIYFTDGWDDIGIWKSAVSV